MFHSCGIVQICPGENSRSLKNALKYPNNIPISVAELKDMILSDTVHYKAVIFYSPCCDPCNTEFKTTYRNALESCDSSVRFYLVLDHCGGVRLNESYLNKKGIFNQEMYYIRDSTMHFKPWNEDRFTNMVNYIFSLKQEIIEDNGIPKNFIVSKYNRLKIIRFHQNSQMGVSQNIKAMDLYLLEGYDFSKIDFDIVEDVWIGTEPSCEPGKCK